MGNEVCVLQLMRAVAHHHKATREEIRRVTQFHDLECWSLLQLSPGSLLP
jgi:hypothetical protein